MKLNGPGKYDDLATYVREQSDAEMVVIIVKNGNEGNGFAVQAVHPGHLLTLPDILDEVAAGIRQDVAG